MMRVLSAGWGTPTGDSAEMYMLYGASIRLGY